MEIIENIYLKMCIYQPYRNIKKVLKYPIISTIHTKSLEISRLYFFEVLKKYYLFYFPIKTFLNISSSLFSSFKTVSSTGFEILEV